MRIRRTCSKSNFCINDCICFDNLRRIDIPDRICCFGKRQHCVFRLTNIKACEGDKLNKDILSEKTIERLTKNGIVDLATYAKTVDIFCAEIMEQVYSQREENGITAPDFDELTLNGYDFYNNRTATEYLARRIAEQCHNQFQSIRKLRER